MPIRAADDFDTIRKRLEELRKEQILAEGRTVNLNGEQIGPCQQCRTECVPCKGYCCD